MRRMLDEIWSEVTFICFVECYNIHIQQRDGHEIEQLSTEKHSLLLKTTRNVSSSIRHKILEKVGVVAAKATFRRNQLSSRMKQVS